MVVYCSLFYVRFKVTGDCSDIPWLIRLHSYYEMVKIIQKIITGDEVMDVIILAAGPGTPQKVTGEENITGDEVIQVSFLIATP